MVAVQSDGCAPVVKAFHDGLKEPIFWENASTEAAGLRIPATVGGRLMLQALRESSGTAVMVSDEAMHEAVKLLATTEGIFAGLEAAAAVAGAQELDKQGWFNSEERIVLFCTGSGLKQNLPLM